MVRKLFAFVWRVLPVLLGVSLEALQFGRVVLRSHSALVAENLFLRRQLAFYQERNIKPRRLTLSARFALLFWSRWFPWGNALVVVKPETLIGWHRRAFQLFWRWKSRGGRPKLPKNLRVLIADMVRENPSWGEARIAAELALKLGIRVSPRTVRAYWPRELRPNGTRSQNWSTFVQNHAKAMVACDFAVSVTVQFRILYVFLVMEVGSRRLVHVNVTGHPTALWTCQQLREAIPSDHAYRWLIHDRSGIFSEDVDRAIRSLGVETLKTPVRAPQANAYCERLIGSLRRECLDWFLPLNERHLRTLVRAWASHYNRGRPHRSLGPGIPDPPAGLPVRGQVQRHRLPDRSLVERRSVLGGLHHEYRLEEVAA